MRIDRLLAMTVLLLNRGRVSAKELAERFEVSTKTIYRDMETLSQAGIPIVAQQGTAGGFEIMESYTMARQLLSLKEMNSLVSAVKGMNTALDDHTIEVLLDKVQALLSKADKLQRDQQGTEMIFDFNPWGQGPAARDKVNQLRQAIEDTTLVSIRYLNMNGTESGRIIEPAALILKGNLWYLQAYCKLRSEFRVFRLSRIVDLDVLQKSFVRRVVPSMDGYSWDPDWSTDHKLDVTLVFHPSVRHRLLDAFHSNQMTVRSDGSIQVHGEFTEDDWFYGMLLSYGDQVHVEQPPSVAEEVLKRANQIVAKYSN